MAPGYLTGSGVGKGNEKGTFAVAPLPQSDPSSPVSVNWGGSTFAVSWQAGDKKLAAEVAKGLYADDASLTDGWKTQTIFPLNQNVLKSDAFTNNAVDFFGGQTANKDIYIPAENAYKGFNYIFALIGTLQFFSEPQILGLVANGSITPDFTPNIYAFNLAFGYAQFKTVHRRKRQRPPSI